MRTEEEIRRSVSEAYSRAVSRPVEGTCCGSPAPQGVAAKLAGYTSEELASLPPQAVVNSFGCGNPLALSEIREGDVVVDLGSGAGIDILLAAKRVGPTGRAIGIDMTEEMLAKARENIAAAGLGNVEVRKGIIEELPVESSSADWVISNCVINLSPDKPRVFAEIARVLKPGGRMLVSDIVARDLPEWVKGNQALYCSCIAGAISEEEYLDGLRRAGLEDAEVRERIVYDRSQLIALVKSELPQLERVFACCAGAIGEEIIARIAGSVEGKIWSAKFYARKPL